jgi:hypothetical protein
MTVFLPPDVLEEVGHGGKFWVAAEGRIIRRRAHLLPNSSGKLVPGSRRETHFNGHLVLRGDYTVAGMDERVAAFWTPQGRRIG